MNKKKKGDLKELLMVFVDVFFASILSVVFSFASDWKFYYIYFLLSLIWFALMDIKSGKVLSK